MLPEVLDVVKTVAIVAGSLCAIAAYLKTQRAHKEALNAQVFLTLTDRHAKLIGIRRLDADLRLIEPWDGSSETAHAVREYFDLLSHEHELVRLGILDRRIWDLWQPDITRLVNSRLVSHVWSERTRALHRASPEFVAYVDAKISTRGGAFRDGHTGGSVRIVAPAPPMSHASTRPAPIRP